MAEIFISVGKRCLHLRSDVHRAATFIKAYAPAHHASCGYIVPEDKLQPQGYGQLPQDVIGAPARLARY